MTEAEQKALALVNEVLAERRLPLYDEEDIAANTYVAAAICRAIEQHEAFKREVSDAIDSSVLTPETEAHLSRFIIAKPDPLVEAVNEAWGWRNPHEDVTENLRAALAARGLTITETKE